MKAIGDRMKSNYELPGRQTLLRRVPVIIRVDGRAFHTLTRHMERPFDHSFIKAMAHAAIALASEIQGCKVAYVQSDEASFLVTDYDTHQTDAWFGYVKSKVESISASIMTAAFNRELRLDGTAHFDSRAFNIPREEVVNYFLWRALDWERNSLNMYCQSFFSHSKLEGKSNADRHEMLHSIDKNWADLSAVEKNGSWIKPSGEWIEGFAPTYESISELLEPMIYCDRECE